MPDQKHLKLNDSLGFSPLFFYVFFHNNYQIIHNNYLLIINNYQVIAGLHSVLTWDMATVQQRKIGNLYPHPSKKLNHTYPQGAWGSVGKVDPPMNIFRE